MLAVADLLARRRPELIAIMAHEAAKTIAEGNPEVSEAIDFARYYAERIAELDQRDGAEFEPLGVVAVVPPWNFPLAIPAGGVVAALAAGNAVVLEARAADAAHRLRDRAGVLGRGRAARDAPICSLPRFGRR